MLKKMLNKPFQLMAIFGCVYLITTLLLNIFTDFSFKNDYYPFTKPIAYTTEGIVLLLFILTCFFYTKHILYFIAAELLIFSNLYTGDIFSALFLSSILLALLLSEYKTISKKAIIIYGIIEIIKIALVFPFGYTQLFYYIGLSLFTLCTIGCINLLFRHAYLKNENPTTLNLDNFKLTDRQKDCIKEIVLNNTTIKALALNHNVSESAIKKDLAHVYKVMGITGKADLKALFIGYKF